MKSITKISKQESRKTNSELVETIRFAKKHKAWLKVAGILSSPRRKRTDVNLDKIEKEAGEGMIIVPGKVLSLGEITKKVRIAALGFSTKAEEKLKKAGAQPMNILEAIKSNVKAENIKILK